MNSWPTCTVADCANKACLGLSNTLCFPHYFRLPMDAQGHAVFPNEETRIRLQGILQAALDKFRAEDPTS
jgi:hypothetical protein